MKKTCKYCGTENRQIALFCKKCGKEIEELKSDALSFITGRDELKAVLNELVTSVSQFKKSWTEKASFNINMLLLGNTGTGKTLLAGIISRYLFETNIVAKEEAFVFDASEYDAFIENIEDNFKKAKGGIIFIDNIDKILSAGLKSGNVTGVDRLLFEMDKTKNDPVVILAGKRDVFEEYIIEHSALNSRFEYHFRLNDFSSGELYTICKQKLNEYGLKLNEISANKLLSFFKYSVRVKDQTFGNAHLSVNTAEDIARTYFYRVSQGGSDNKVISDDDIKKEVPELKSLNQVLAELDELIGLEKVKAAVREIASFVKSEQNKKQEGEEKKIGMHIVLTGNPGTGKTTIARKLGEILAALDFLDRGHVVEVDRSGLVGQYLGETALKVQKKCDEAMGGVLFVDEAYALASGNKSGNDFGQEAIDTLLKRMEDDRDKFVVIAAGYRKEMDRFLKANTGLPSRFDRFIDIEDYMPTELSSIFIFMASKNGYTLTSDAEDKINSLTEVMYNKRDRNFANGREVRKLFEQTIINVSKREPDSSDNLITVTDIPGAENKEMNLEGIFEELNHLIGLKEIKEELYKLAIYQKVEAARKEITGKYETLDSHYVFMGNPGTGKTTVARYLGKIFKALGVLSSGHVVEADRSDLVGAYVGHTSEKTNELIDSAMGGVLFIDEAYSLVIESSQNDFGTQAIQILLKRMDDDRGKFITVVAGYPNEMDKFVSSNPGLDSRFKKKIKFRDYTADELLDIFKKFIKDKGLVLTEEAEERAREIMTDLYTQRDENFGNGRTVRNYFEEVLENQSFRIAKHLDQPVKDKEILLTIEKEDIE